MDEAFKLVLCSLESMAEENVREEEFQYNKVHDPNADTNITFWPNPELKMHQLVAESHNRQETPLFAASIERAALNR
jgi:hypothetical protein